MKAWLESDGVYIRPATEYPLNARDRHSDWLERYRDGESVTKIAEVYGVNRSSVYRVLKEKYGYRPKGRGN